MYGMEQQREGSSTAPPHLLRFTLQFLARKSGGRVELIVWWGAHDAEIGTAISIVE